MAQRFINFNWRLVFYWNFDLNFWLADFGAARGTWFFINFSGYFKHSTNMKTAQFLNFSFIFNHNLSYTAAVANHNKVKPTQQPFFVQPALEHDFSTGMQNHIPRQNSFHPVKTSPLADKDRSEEQ